MGVSISFVCETTLHETFLFAAPFIILHLTPDCSFLSGKTLSQKGTFLRQCVESFTGTSAIENVLNRLASGYHRRPTWCPWGDLGASLCVNNRRY